MTKQRDRLGILLLILGAVLRIVYVTIFHPIHQDLISDMARYVGRAQLILVGNWNDYQFFQPIGFSYLIAGLMSIMEKWWIGLAILHVIVSMLTMWLIWKCATKSFGRKVGWVSLGLVAIHAQWIIYTGLALTETFTAFCFALLLWISIQMLENGNNKKLHAVFWAVVFCTAFLLKGTAAFLAPMFVTALLLERKKASTQNAIVISVIGVLFLLGHGMFTQAKIGKFQVAPSASGLNFVAGKCESKRNIDSEGRRFLSPLYYQLGRSNQKTWDHPFTDSEFFLAEGFKCILDRPLVLVQSLEGIPYLFVGNRLWPTKYLQFATQAKIYEWLFAIFAIPALLWLLICSREIQRHEWVIWWYPFFALCLCVYVFSSEIRFRIPFDVWIIPLAVQGWAKIMKTVFEKKSLN